MAREMLRAQSGLFGLGILVASGTLAWQGVVQARQFFKVQSEISKLSSIMNVSKELSRKLTAEFLRQMDEGLSGERKGTLSMLPSWLQSLPSGHEAGVALAIDFGGTCFRIMEVILGKAPNEIDLISSMEIDIPSTIYTGSITDLYGFIASQVAKFAADRGLLVPDASIKSPETMKTSTSKVASSSAQAPEPSGQSQSIQGDASTAQPCSSTQQSDDTAVVQLQHECTSLQSDSHDGCAETSAESSGRSQGACLAGSPRVPSLGLNEGRSDGRDQAGNSAMEAQKKPRMKGPPIGFCFSFPMEQSALTRGQLLRWTKGFDLQDGIGSNPVEMLKSSLQQQGWEPNIVALMNDGVGVFGAGRYLNSQTCVSFILGTGTNAAYVERVCNVPAMSGQCAALSGTGEASVSTDSVRDANTVINTEWGAFDSDLLPRTLADVEVDSHSLRPGAQSFEKLVSGMYLGEIVRRSLLHIVEATGILTKSTWGRMPLADSLTAPQVQIIDEDDSASQRRTAGVLMHAFGMRRPHCSLVLCWTRTADLIAAGLTALLTKVGAPSHPGVYAIAVEGSVYHKYPKFRERLHSALEKCLLPLGGRLVKPEADVDSSWDDLESGKFRVEIVDAQNGSCFGAAVIAATASGDSLGRYTRELPSRDVSQLSTATSFPGQSFLRRRNVSQIAASKDCD